MSKQLLVYAFGPGANFEGRLVGALERIESGGALRILDVGPDTRGRVSRTGGTPLASEFVDATTLAELAPVVIAAAQPTRD